MDIGVFLCVVHCKTRSLDFKTWSFDQHAMHLFCNMASFLASSAVMMMIDMHPYRTCDLCMQHSHQIIHEHAVVTESVEAGYAHNS